MLLYHCFSEALVGVSCFFIRYPKKEKSFCLRCDRECRFDMFTIRVLQTWYLFTFTMMFLSFRSFSGRLHSDSKCSHVNTQTSPHLTSPQLKPQASRPTSQINQPYPPIPSSQPSNYLSTYKKSHVSSKRPCQNAPQDGPYFLKSL